MAEHTDEKKKSKRKFLRLLLMLFLLTAVGAGVFLLTRSAPAKSGLSYEDNVVVGALTDKTEQERIAELNEQVERGQVSISINATPCTASDGSGEVNWNIENPPNQGKLIRVEIYLSKTEEQVFSTGAIKPDNSLPVGKLSQDLAAGTYPCTAYFMTYDLETEAYIGRGGADIVLTVT